MILLNGHSLTLLRKVDVETQALVLKERQSTSSFTTTDTTGISINSWMQDETNPGAGIVWRVKSIEQAYTVNNPKINLEHAINTLRDRILFGEITPETIAGSGATTCTAKQAINYILSQQSDWVLDENSFPYSSVSNPYKFDGDTLFDALEMVTKSLQDSWWDYDFSSYPFKLKIIQKQSGVACEMREGRNIKAISKTIDKTGMYTRFYPIGKDDLHITGDYVSRNESTYGIISKVEVDSSLETTSELTAWANERLDKHAQPVVTVTVDGMDFADATGESLDRLTLGRLCRIPLPEFSTTIEERIIELNYRDKKQKPEEVRITMGNQRDDLTHIIADEIKQGGGQSGSGRGGGGRGSVRQQKEDHAWFEDTDEHVAMCAEGIVGVDAYGKPNWVRLSQLIVDGAGIHGNVTSLIDGALYQQSKVEMSESQISLVVGRYNDQNYIKAAEIVTAINDADEGVVHISADHVYMGTVGNENPIDVVINGKLTTTELASQIALLNAVAINTLNIQTLIDAPLITGTEGQIDDISCDTLSLSGSSSFDDCLIDASVSNNTLTLTYASGSTVTFSKATTLSGAWSSGALTVTASPQGETFVADLFTAGHWGTTANNENTKHYYGSISAKHNGGSTSYTTGEYFEIDASSIYTAGVNSVTHSIGFSPQSGTGTTCSIEAACQHQVGSSWVDWARSTRTLYLSTSGNTVTLKDQNGTVMGQATTSGGGGTSYSMYCSYKSTSGGVNNYTFTLQHSTNFTVGNYYTFYR